MCVQTMQQPSIQASLAYGHPARQSFLAPLRCSDEPSLAGSARPQQASPARPPFVVASHPLPLGAGASLCEHMS